MTLGNKEKPVTLPPFSSEIQYIKSGVGTDWSHVYYDIEKLHEKGKKGEGVKIGILDTGVDLSHNSFRSAIDEGRLKGFDARKGLNNPADLNGHGTWCVSRFISNGNEVLGFSPHATVYSYKVLNNNGSGNLDNVISGAEMAIKDGCHIISSSLGWSGIVPQFENVVKEAEKNNIIWVSASGNDGTLEDIDYPALYNYVLSIGSHGANGSRSDFSDFGVALDYYSSGDNVLGAYTKNREAYLRGTSMATPSFGALLALVYFDILKEYGAINREIINKLVRCRQ